MDSKEDKYSFEVKPSQFSEEMAGDTDTEEVVQGLLPGLLGESWITDTDKVVSGDTDEVVLGVIELDEVAFDEDKDDDNGTE